MTKNYSIKIQWNPLASQKISEFLKTTCDVVFFGSPQVLSLFHQIGATKMRQGRHGDVLLVEWVDGNNLVGEDSLMKMVSTLVPPQKRLVFVVFSG